MFTELKKPFTFTPVENPVVWGFISDYSGTTGVFLVEILDKNEFPFLIFIAYSLPNSPNPGEDLYINISDKMKSLVTATIENEPELTRPKPRNIFAYKVRVYDYTRIDNIWQQFGTGYTSSLNYVWEAKFDKLFLSEYDGWGLEDDKNIFLVKSNKINRRFLTNQPSIKSINEFSYEQLYFIQQGFIYGTNDVRLVIKKNGSIVYNTQIDGRPGIEFRGYAQFNVTLTRFGPQPCDTHTITVDDYNLGTITLLNGPVCFSPNWNNEAYVNALANAINTNTYGYIAEPIITPGINTVFIKISNPNGYGDLNNGQQMFITRPIVNTIPPVIQNLTQNVCCGGFEDDLVNMIRLNVSPEVLLTEGISLTNGDKLEVYLTNSGGTKITESRYYNYTIVPCNDEIVNVFFSNSLGGVDSIQMITPKITNKYKRTELKIEDINITNRTNYENVDEINVYVNEELDTFSFVGQSNEFSFGTLTPEKRIINNVERLVVTLSTYPLSEEQSKWLLELIFSKEVYFAIGDDHQLLPVSVLTTQYEIKKKKYNQGQLIQYDIEFELPKNYNKILNKITNYGI